MSTNNLLAKEDYWAIWIGAGLLLFGLAVFVLNPSEDLKQRHAKLETTLLEEEKKAPFKTVNWYVVFNEQKNIKASSLPIGKLLKNLTSKPSKWDGNPLDAFITSSEKINANKENTKTKYLNTLALANSQKTAALMAETAAAGANFEDAALNRVAVSAIDNWRKAVDDMSSAKKKYEAKPINRIPWFLGLLLFLGVLFAVGVAVMGTPFMTFVKGFIYVFIIALMAYLLAAQVNMKAIGFGYAAWAIVIGLLISNTVGTPEWVKPALTTEFYIKTGLVILGAEILFGKILAIGLPGIFVAWVVTPIVLITSYWFGQKVLKISSKTLNMTIAADMSVCGVSAAVATAAACKASREELTVAIGLSMIFTSVMMIVMPAFINYMEMPEILGGAWIGGTIDATGAVVAAGAFLGDKALNVAATIKMIQNVLIGIIAFGVAIYFATKEKDERNESGISTIEVPATTHSFTKEIWLRFPKFILGFIGASILFSIIYAGLGDNLGYSLIDQGVIGGFTKNIRGWLFCLAFVSIGLSINFKELRKHFVGGKPLMLYLCGQLFNLCLTLLMAYIMFYLVFPYITAQI